jgi:hypothetical protein
MKKWKMPETLTSCVRYHHESQKTTNPLSFIIAYGDYLSHLHGSQGEEIDDGSMDVDTMVANLALPDQQSQDLYDVVIGDFKWADVFD